MSKVGILVDSTSDMSPSELEAIGVRHIPLIVRIDGVEYRDGVEITPVEFYPKLMVAKDLPQTSQPTPADFLAIYREMAEAGFDEVVVITLSEALSGTHQSADIASKESPIPVHLVNSVSVSPGLALMVMYAAELRDSGLSAEAIADEIRACTHRTGLYVVIGTMEYLVKGGRAGKTAGLAASLLNIKPILRVNEEGVLEPVAKIKGTAKAIEHLAGVVAEATAGHSDVRYMIAATSDTTLSDQLRAAMLAAGVTGVEARPGRVGPVVGTHAGTDAVAVGYLIVK